MVPDAKNVFEVVAVLLPIMIATDFHFTIYVFGYRFSFSQRGFACFCFSLTLRVINIILKKKGIKCDFNFSITVYFYSFISFFTYLSRTSSRSFSLFSILVSMSTKESVSIITLPSSL